MFVIKEQTSGIYIYCQARYMLTRCERNRDILQKCRNQCELLELFEKDDTLEENNYKYQKY